MSEKLYQYQGYVGRLHELRNIIPEKYMLWKENKSQTILGFIRKQITKVKCEQNTNGNVEDFSHIYR